MNSVYAISRYVLRDSRNALLIFYSIIAILIIGSGIISMNVSLNGGNVEFGGIGMSAVIFLFISALNSFKINYKFMQSFNISRKKFFMGSIIALITLALFMSVIDVTFNNVFKSVTNYKGVFEQTYGSNFFIDDFFWSLALFIFVASLGWFITLLYYRCNKLMKTVISIAPVLVIILISIIDGIANISIWGSIVQFLGRVLGFTNGYNSYTAVITFIVSAMLCFGLSYLLIRRATIKD